MKKNKIKNDNNKKTNEAIFLGLNEKPSPHGPKSASPGNRRLSNLLY